VRRFLLTGDDMALPCDGCYGCGSGARAPGAKLAPVDERSLLDEAATRELCHLITPALLRKPEWLNLSRG
jgi:hypothetical protein